MNKSRETRFKKSVEELHSRLGRAENFLDTEMIRRDNKSDRFRIRGDETHRSSLPSEVYRDKNTLVEVTVHRNSQANKSKTRIQPKSWAESLSDSDLQFDKPTKSSLAKAKPSPRKKKNLQEASSNREREDERNLHDLVGDLKSILKVTGHENLQDFIADFDKKQKMKSFKVPPSDDVNSVTDLQSKVEKYKVEAEKQKHEAGHYRQECDVLVKQLSISKESLTSLETQIVDLKKIISRLTKNNGELLDIVKEKIKYEDIIADLERKASNLTNQLQKETSSTELLKRRLLESQNENEHLRSLSADLRAHLRSGLSGLQVSRPTSQQAAVPALGDVTKQILGVRGKEEDQSEDSAYEDPNTESLKSRPKSSVRGRTQRPHSSTSAASQSKLSPPTKMINQPEPGVSGNNHLRPANSPTQNFAQGAEHARTQSRSSTLMDTESIQEDKAASFQPLQLDLSETSSQIDSNDVTDPSTRKAPVNIKQSLEDKVSDFLSRINKDSVDISIDIPKPRPFEGGSLHLSLSNSDIDDTYSRVLESNDTTLTEGKFLKGLETSIEVLGNNVSKHSD